MARARVLVCGDVMLDEFLWGRVARISPEAPVPVVEVCRESFHVGGAGNVAQNVRALGGEAILASVVGDDPAGKRIRDALQRAGVAAEMVVGEPERPTTVKTRIVAHHQQVVRADFERTEPIPERLERELQERIRSGVAGVQVVVVSDYDKGVVTPGLMRWLRGLASRRTVPLLVDPKVRHFPLYRGASLITPNQLEAEQASGIQIIDQQSLEAAGQRILKILRCSAALVTRGEQGMSLFRRDAVPVHIPTSAREVFDVTGAGDTVIATLALALSAGANAVEAAELANRAAGIVVGKLGTATAGPAELLGALGAT
jgi:D-beta-D-heptose 7-phosphate kinase/D-beta-D-heptose 1-phosphate adenosyltransferase